MFIIIPVKPFQQAKTRLADVLSPDERFRLSRHLFKRTLHLARQVGEVIVVSQDAAARKLAKQAGAWALVETGNGLNDALGQAIEWVTLHGATASLILPSDLPRLTRADLMGLIQTGQKPDSVVIAPCHRREGTNALLLRPPGLLAPEFGRNSFTRHKNAAQALGLEPIIYHSPTVAFDLDIPADLDLLKKSPAQHRDLFI